MAQKQKATFGYGAIRVPRELLRDLKISAAQRNTSVLRLVSEAVNDYLKKTKQKAA